MKVDIIKRKESIIITAIELLYEAGINGMTRPSVRIVQDGGKSVTPYLMNLKESNYNITIIGVGDALLHQS